MAKTWRAVLDDRVIEEGVKEVSGDADVARALGGPGACGTEGKSGVTWPVCENKALMSGSRSGS